MGALDHQIGFADETTYGTLVTPTRFYEYNSEGIAEAEGRTEGDPLRVGTYVKRSDRFTPYFVGAAGSVQFDVLSKGFGYFLKHMLGAVATDQPDSAGNPTVYRHTGTVGELFGKAFTCQVARPFHPSGTVQPFTFEGGKITEWTISNSVDGNLVLDLGVDFQQVATATALATASYPSSMEPLTWAGGLVTIGGSAYDVTEISIAGSNNLDVDRRQIRANTDKKEPTAGRREITFSLSADFDSLTQRNRAHAAVRADALASLVASWTSPTLISGTYYPKLTVTVPAARFDSWEAAAAGPEAISQSLSGVGLFDGTNSAVSIEYISVDTTP